MIFLGGSCNPTTWRADIAIPLLDAAGVGYYNPQVDQWHPALMEVEAKAKVQADVLLFVIDSQTRAIASMLEAAECICTDRRVVLVIQDIPQDGPPDITFDTGGRKDLNRARAYLRDLALRHDVPISDDIASAIKRCITLVPDQPA